MADMADINTEAKASKQERKQEDPDRDAKEWLSSPPEMLQSHDFTDWITSFDTLSNAAAEKVPLYFVLFQLPYP